MADREPITYDDVTKAFRTNAVLRDPDERLLEYLRVLCSEQIRSDENRLLANNRCITINTILMQRYMQRTNRTTTIYTWVVIILAAVTLLATAVQVGIALGWIKGV